MHKISFRHHFGQQMEKNATLENDNLLLTSFQKMLGTKIKLLHKFLSRPRVCIGEMDFENFLTLILVSIWYQNNQNLNYYACDCFITVFIKVHKNRNKSTFNLVKKLKRIWLHYVNP